MKTADEMPELERLIEDMNGVNCTVTVSKTLIWIGGQTYPVRDILKKNGWKWSPKKKQWWMSLDRYCGWKDESFTPKDGEDYNIFGTAPDVKPVLIAQVTHGSLV